MSERFAASGPLRGALRPPADKSISHRAALFGAMSDTPVSIHNYLYAEDTLSTLHALRVLGAGVDMHDDELVSPTTAAQRLKKAATVDIKVLVDENGRVIDAQRAGAKAGFGFDEAALEAARRAQFKPAMKDGVRVKMWYTLRVAFQPG